MEMCHIVVAGDDASVAEILKVDLGWGFPTTIVPRFLVWVLGI